MSLNPELLWGPSSQRWDSILAPRLRYSGPGYSAGLEKQAAQHKFAILEKKASNEGVLAGSSISFRKHLERISHPPTPDTFYCNPAVPASLKPAFFSLGESLS